RVLTRRAFGASVERPEKACAEAPVAVWRRGSASPFVLFVSFVAKPSSWPCDWPRHVCSTSRRIVPRRVIMKTAGSAARAIDGRLGSHPPPIRDEKKQRLR